MRIVKDIISFLANFRINKKSLVSGLVILILKNRFKIFYYIFSKIWKDYYTTS
jgi:hypothetical protein